MKGNGGAVRIPGRRKLLAAFYTTRPAAEFLATLAIDDPATIVLDPACGDGALLEASFHRKVDLLSRNGAVSAGDLLGLLEGDLLGNDLDPVAVAKTVERLSNLVDARGRSPRVRVRQGDATEADLPKVDAVVMNPPFTRGVNLKQWPSPPEGRAGWGAGYKGRLMERLGKYSEYLDKKMGLHAYFVLLADEFLDGGSPTGGKLAAILPASTLRNGSTSGVRRFLSENYHVQFIVARDDKSAFSENTALREVIVVASCGNRRGVEREKTALVLVHEFPGEPGRARSLAEAIKEVASSGRGVDRADFTARVIPTRDLRSSVSNWYRLLVGISPLGKIWSRLSANTTLVPHRTLVPGDCVVRGVESPAGGTIGGVVLADPRYTTARDRWVVEGRVADRLEVATKKPGHGTREVFSVPAGAVKPCIKSFAGLTTIDTGDLGDSVVVGEFPEIVDFLATGWGKQKTEVDQGFFEGWSKHVGKRRGHLFHARRVDLSAPGSIHLAYYSEVPRVATKLLWVVDASDLVGPGWKFLALWYNSSLHLVQVMLQRAETRGAFLEIGKFIFDDLVVPDYRKKEQFWSRIEGTFERLKGVEFPPILEQLEGNFSGLEEIDELMLELMGVEGVGREAFGRELRRELGKQVRLLKEMMDND
ncbi:MAG: Eco57I restriction-modification methylase domain-containing protein [Promethearchaeota archaeon]